MANKLLIKRSSVPGKVPTTSDLDLGELGVNTYDGKLYLKKDDGSANIVDLTASASLPSQIGNGTKFLYTDGTTATWAVGNTNVPFTLGDGTSKTLPIGGATTGDTINFNIANIGTANLTNADITNLNVTNELIDTKLTFETGASVYVSANNIGWRDITSDIQVKGSGLNNPSWSLIRNGLYAYAFSPTTMNEAWISFHINHDYAVGTPIYLHAHWINSGTNTGIVRWGFEYSIAKGHQQEIFPATSTVYVEQTCTGQYYHMIAEIATGITSASLEPDSLVLVRVFRDAAHANDTCTDPVALVMSDIHYQASKWATKNKAPNFNV